MLERLVDVTLANMHRVHRLWPDVEADFFDIAATGVDVATLQQRLLARGVAVSGLGGRVRPCLHLDVTAPMIDEAVTEISAALAAE